VVILAVIAREEIHPDYISGEKEEPGMGSV